MIRPRFLSAVVVSALSVVGLAGAGSDPFRQPPPRTGNDYVFVFIRTGPATLPDDERAEAFRGHFANMKRMADAGDLLIAGPFGEPLSAPDHRGLFVIDRPTLEAGMTIANTDPTTIAGVFVLEGHVFTTIAPLRKLPAMERADEQRRNADPDAPEAWEGRAYMLATAPYTELRLKAAYNTKGILIAGQLHGSGPDHADEVLVWLDAETVPEARGILPEPDRWTLHGWYGSKMVAELH